MSRKALEPRGTLRAEKTTPEKAPESVGLAADQRREERRPADGLVKVRFGLPEREVVGRLVDVSTSGFRIAHDCRTLETGQTVEFSHPEAQGKARVVWNRIAGTGVESGLLLVQSPNTSV
jgi:hypothetical protein